MSDDQLRQSLEDVQNEMDGIPADGDAGHSLMERVRLELSEALNPDLDNDYESLRERMEETLIHFGEDHPKIAAALRRAIDVMNIGGV